MTSTRWDSDDAQFVATAIADQSLCIPCLIARTGVTRARAEAVLGTLAQTLTITRTLARCDPCRRTRALYRLA